MKPGKDLDELCYPYIYEPSWLCDYEVLTDELCALVGTILAALPADYVDLNADLEQLQPLLFHANGSVRGRLALSDADLAWVHARLDHYRAELRDVAPGFVLPRGAAPVPQLHQARSGCKKAIRALVRVEQEGIAIPDLIPRFLNLLCNLFFVLTRVVNRRRGLTEPAFISLSYPQRHG